MSQPTIRPMLLQDLPQVLHIEKLSHVDPWTEQIFKDCLRLPYLNWILLVDEQCIGFIIISHVVDEYHILNIAIHPDHRGQGHGQRLITHQINRARVQQVAKIHLEVRCSNQPAISMYEKLDFVQVGSRADYYPSPSGREDALLLTLFL